jgi:hypothetical protein
MKANRGVGGSWFGIGGLTGERCAVVHLGGHSREKGWHWLIAVASGGGGTFRTWLWCVQPQPCSADLCTASVGAALLRRLPWRS